MKDRLVSLDVFRGFTIASMILVNNFESDSYPILNHAIWDGWTFADIIFPFFLWITGMALVFSLTKRLKEQSWLSVFLQVARRSAILFLLGVFLYNFPYFDLTTIRIPGVLQRIGICYFLAGCIFLTTKARGQIIITLAVILGYWGLLTLVPFPHNKVYDVLSQDNNLVQYVDARLLKNHLYAADFDPEGILSTLGALGSTLCGMLAGHVLLQGDAKKRNALFFLGSGISFFLIGMMLNTWIAINKNLWTSSYVFFMAGLASIIFALLYFLIDIKGYQRWSKPFAIYGLNPITFYALSDLMYKFLTLTTIKSNSTWEFLLKYLYIPFLGDANGHLAFSFSLVLFFYGIAYLLFKKHIVIKI